MERQTPNCGYGDEWGHNFIRPLMICNNKNPAKLDTKDLLFTVKPPKQMNIDKVENHFTIKQGNLANQCYNVHFRELKALFLTYSEPWQSCNQRRNLPLPLLRFLALLLRCQMEGPILTLDCFALSLHPPQVDFFPTCYVLHKSPCPIKHHQDFFLKKNKPSQFSV